MYSVLRIFAIIGLALVGGAASLYFEFFPGPYLNEAFGGLRALLVQAEQQQNEFNAGGVFKADPERRGVTRHSPDEAFQGYTVFAMGQGTTVPLINMQGDVVHEWRASYPEIWDASGDVQQPVPGRFTFVRRAKVYPDGRLLIIFSAWSTTPYGYGIAMLDRDSNVLWKDFRHIHHSFDQAEDGRIYALDQKIEQKVPQGYWGVTAPYLDDGIAIYSGDGVFEKRFSLISALHNSIYRDILLYVASHNAREGVGDLIHANDVDVLPAALADQFPFGKPGDLLVSLRELDAIALVDPVTEKVTWLQRGYWRRQHDADFLDNGNILLFDNLALQYDAKGRRSSRIVEFNPQDMQQQWRYQANDERFFSIARGSQQRLGNGNTLISESHSARIFEVNPSGKIVWEYFNQTRLGEGEAMVPAVFWGTRYSPDQLPFLSP